MKAKTKFVCSECGYESVKWLGKCPSCGNWNTFNEETGKRIAKSKVNIKLYRMLEHCVKLMADDLYKTAYYASICKESIYELRLREQDHLKELSR